MPCHAIPCHAMPCHAMPCHDMLNNLQTARAEGVLAVSKRFNTVGANKKWPLWPPAVAPRGPPWSPVVPRG
eukprot:12842673-Heterocapsa_arctica.AAC.1